MMLEILADAPTYRQAGCRTPGVNYLHLGLGFLVLEQAFEVYLHVRQRRMLAKPRLPQELVELVGDIDNKQEAAPAEPPVQDMQRTPKPTRSLLGKLKEKFASSQLYQMEMNSFKMVSIAFAMGTSAALLLTGTSAWMWDCSRWLLTSVFGLERPGELAVGSVFLAGESLLGALVQLPLSVYRTFVIEAKHGFNKTTPGLFVSDWVKHLLVEVALTVPLMAGVAKLVRLGGETFWVYVWLLVVAFTLLMLTVYPNYIMPLFNEYKPLPDGELKSAIETLASSQDFPLTKLYEVDGSKRSSHSNAYLYGFWKDKRIVLFDTLIKNPEEPALECTTDEIVSILGHELGHWKLNHTVKGFVLQNALLLVGLKAFGSFVHNADMYAAFGFSEMPVVVGFNLFNTVISPVGAVISLLFNSLTRRFEFEADAFGVALGKARGLKSGLCKLLIANLASFEVDPLFHAFHHSHPTLLERLREMDAQEVKRSKKAL